MATLEEVSNWFIVLSQHRIIEVAHIILMSVMVRDDINNNVKDKSFIVHHPVASLIATFLSIYAGGTMASVLLGKFALVPFLDNINVAIILCVWFLLNFSTFDGLYRFITWRPVFLIVNLLKEVQRCRRVYDGVLIVRDLYPHAYLVMFLTGVLRGVGASYIRPLIRLVYGVWIPVPNEIMQPSLTTKITAYSAAAFTILQVVPVASASHDNMFTSISVVMISIRILCFVDVFNDPFTHGEKMAESLVTLVAGTKATSTSSDKSTVSSSASASQPKKIEKVASSGSLTTRTKTKKGGDS